MKNSIEATGYILVLFLCWILCLTGYTAPVYPDPPATLGVPVIGQEGVYLCWAACTEMVTTYFSQRVPNAPIIHQCEEVKHYLPSLDTVPCPANLLGTVFDQTGVPLSNMTDFNLYYKTQYLANPGFPIIAIPRDTIATELLNHRPVIFSWEWEKGEDTIVGDHGAHYLIAEGRPKCNYGGREGWVAINDPEPVLSGHHRIINFSEFSNTEPDPLREGDQGHPRDYNRKAIYFKHGADYYGLQFVGGGN